MKKSEIFERVVDIVADECEVNRDLVIHDRRIHAVVEARCMCVYILKKAGLTSDDIALIVLRLKKDGKINPGYCPPMEEIKAKAKAIDDMNMSFYDRYDSSRYFRLAYADVKKAVLKAYSEVSDLLGVDML